MNIEKFTNRSKEALQAAHNEALERSHQELHPIHILYALLNQDEGLISSLLKKMEVNTAKLNTDVEQALKAIPSVTGGGASQILPVTGIQRTFDQSD